LIVTRLQQMHLCLAMSSPMYVAHTSMRTLNGIFTFFRGTSAGVLLALILSNMGTKYLEERILFLFLFLGMHSLV